MKKKSLFIVYLFILILLALVGCSFNTATLAPTLTNTPLPTLTPTVTPTKTPIPTWTPIGATQLPTTPPPQTIIELATNNPIDLNTYEPPQFMHPLFHSSDINPGYSISVWNHENDEFYAFDISFEDQNLITDPSNANTPIYMPDDLIFIKAYETPKSVKNDSKLDNYDMYFYLPNTQMIMKFSHVLPGPGISYLGDGPSIDNITLEDTIHYDPNTVIAYIGDDGEFIPHLHIEVQYFLPELMKDKKIIYGTGYLELDPHESNTLCEDNKPPCWKDGSPIPALRVTDLFLDGYSWVE